MTEAAEVIDADRVASPNLHPVTETVVALTGDAPPAAPPAVEMSAAQSAQKPVTPANTTDPKGRARTDRQGRAFDPALHEVDAATGLAVLRTDGRLQIRADARRKGAAAIGGSASRLPPSASPTPPPASAGAPGAPPIDAPPPVNYAEVAKQLAVPALGLATVALGADEWSFEKAERDQYLDVTEQLCRKYNITGGVPPEFQLAMLMVSSVAARAGKPRTGAWLARVKESTVSLLVRMGWLKRKPRPEPEKPAPEPEKSEGEQPQQGSTFP